MENKLIPLTEFVNRIDELVPENYTSSNRRISEIKDRYETIKRYASFLSRPLTLSMFVPCDDKGNVLQDPGLMPSQQLNDYREAKSNVLFEGFELKNGKIKNKEGYTVFLYNSVNNRFSDDSTENYTIDRIELLLEYCICDLTPSALKQIYG